MKYKLVAVDVDGTLLDSQSKLAPETITAIQETTAAGVIVTICTGRPIQGVEPLIAELGLDLPFITYNGAKIVMGKSRKILYAQTMRGEDVKTVYQLGTGLKTTVAIWADNKLYVQPFGPEATVYAGHSRVEPQPITDLEALIAQGVTKVLFFDKVEAIRHFVKQVAPAVPPTVNYCTSLPFMLEFFDQEISKANALARLSAYYGFTREEIIAIGDGFNDLPMIKYAGLGIAMANADAAIKQQADYVTLSNDENGVAHALYRFCLNQGR
ncbi:MAG: HAD family phosphatase [Firmicutes bacterium]|nr:HAD family phosphatase [Bacillota bacterium]